MSNDIQIKCHWCGRRITGDYFRSFSGSYCCKRCQVKGDEQLQNEIAEAGGLSEYRKKQRKESLKRVLLSKYFVSICIVGVIIIADKVFY